jgi:hypothetical protein
LRICNTVKPLRIIFGQLAQSKIQGMKYEQFRIMCLGEFNTF